ncbi:hypothetical protein EGP95_07180, partial [bacterium]|nr:hypothetical protein [bacterium]
AEETNGGLNDEKTLLEMNIEAKTQELKDLQERLSALKEYMKTTNADEIEAKEAMDEVARKIVYSIDYKKSMQEIIESNSKNVVDIEDGFIFESNVSSIDRSFDGHPGTKNARLNKNNKYGTIEKNTNKGIYGKYNNEKNVSLVEVGEKEDLKLGEATIRTVLDNKEIKEYKIKITKIDKKSDTKNIYFEITDDELLSKTGGVIQGMSGSPILQNGKIFGAVTHVVVENVKSGYGIFITTMLNEGEK